MKKLLQYIAVVSALVSMFSCAEEVDYSTTGGIYGVVTDADTNQPIQGANVVLSPTSISTVTGADGGFEFQNLEAQQYKLTVTASGYTYNSRQVTVTAGQNISGDVNLTTEEEINGFSLSTNSLLFGGTYSELVFYITNTGNSSATSWSITGIDEEWLSVSPLYGTTDVGKSSSIKVTIDRSYITDDVMTYFIVNAGGGSEEILVTASKANSSGGNESNEADSFSISTTTLDFGEDCDRLEFTITNSGIVDFDYGIWLVQPEWLLFGWDDTTVEANSSETVIVAIDRDKLYGDGLVTFEVRTDVGSKYITITAYEPIDYGTVASCDRDIDISVTGVETSGTTAYIYFKMINNGSETHVDFRVGQPYSATMYTIDDNSNTYSYDSKNMSITINDKTISYYLGYSNYQYVQNSFIGGGGSLTGTIKITDLDSSASKFKTISVGTYAYGSSNQLDETSFKLYDVPIIR